MTRRVVAQVGALLAVTLQALACAPDRVETVPEGEAGLEARIRARLDSLDATSSIYAKHLPTGREIAIRADLPLSTRSVIKIPALVLAYRDAEAGRLQLDARHPITPDELRGGSGLLRTFAPGLEPTYRDLLTQMIITSDNTATDIVLNTVGLARVNEMLATLGYRETRVRRTTGDLFRARLVWEDSANASLTHREVFERGGAGSGPGVQERDFAFAGDSTEWFGRSTTREISRLLEQIYEGELTSRASSDEMISILRRQMSTSRLPQRVRYQGVSVAHKTGDGPPNAGNDVGILFYEGGPTVVAVFTYQNRGSFFDLEAMIGKIAEDLVRSWQ